MSHFNVTSLYGVVCAVVNFVLLVVYYLVNINLLVEWYTSVLALIVTAAFLFAGTVAARNAQEGSFSFGQAWMASMTVAFVAQFLGAALTVLLYEIIAPELPSLLEQMTLEKTREMMEGFGISADLLKMQMREIKEAMKEAYTVKGLTLNAAGGMLMWAIVSLIVAAVTRRNLNSEFA